MPDRRLVAEVVPVVRLPRQQTFFDYAVPEEIGTLAAGDLVVVNFRGRSSLGVVVGSKKKSNLAGALKPVLNLLAAGYVRSEQLKLAKWLSEHYGVALSLAIKSCLPVLPNRRYQPGSLEPSPVIKKSNSARAFLFVAGHNQAEFKLVNSLISKVLARRQQVLFLLPTKNELTVWQKKLADWPSRSFLPDDKVAAQRAVWEACRLGRVSVIMGLRSALFLPYVNLGGIIMLGAEDENYKQWDQNPRYESIEVASQLSYYHGVSLALISSAPSLSMWWQAKVGRLSWRNLAGALGKFKVIDMADCRRAGETGIVSEFLLKEINQRLRQNQSVFLYLNRRGTATAVVCRDCGYVPLCPTCQRALVWQAGLNQLLCYHCNLQKPLPLPCPNCGGHNLDYKGLGLEKLVAEIKILWPEVKPLVIEGDNYKPPAIKPASLIIGSQAAWSQLDLARVSLVAFVMPDGELAVPEFKASELVWQKARRVLSSGANLVVQTYRPEHHLWQSLLKADMDLFYQTEKTIRADYSYPPLVELVRFIVQNSNNSLAKKQAQDLHKKLQTVLPPGSTLSAVYADYYLKVRGQYRYYSLLKYQAGSNLGKLWKVLPAEVIVDRHPLTILS